MLQKVNTLSMKYILNFLAIRKVFLEFQEFAKGIFEGRKLKILIQDRYLYMNLLVEFFKSVQI